MNLTIYIKHCQYFAKIPNKPSKKFQTLLNFTKVVKFLPCLVTLDRLTNDSTKVVYQQNFLSYSFSPLASLSPS